jgi:DNA-binding NarL/FixJ family response regulator
MERGPASSTVIYFIATRYDSVIRAARLHGGATGYRCQRRAISLGDCFYLHNVLCTATALWKEIDMMAAADETSIIRVGLIDPERVLRSMIALLFGTVMELVLSASDYDGFFAAIAAGGSVPTVIIFDPSAANIGRTFGFIDATKQMTPIPRLVAFSGTPSPVQAYLLLRRSVRGYVSKRSDPQHLVTAVRAAVRNRVWVDGTIGSRLQHVMHLPWLTKRELQIALSVANGRTNQEIASLLGIAAVTVRKHLANVNQKLHLRNRAEVIAFLVMNGLLPYNEIAFSEEA